MMWPAAAPKLRWGKKMEEVTEKNLWSLAMQTSWVAILASDHGMFSYLPHVHEM